ncbi:MAG: hypothetical protein J6B31_09285 [Bacteroidaceae bacterium]|nr:hypothetical protein [Bacteroidaceae bacterium]
MKKFIYIVSIFCLLLSSCGTTDVWEDWANEGVLSENRLRPSELKETLLGTDIWKLNCQGVNFYYQFDDSKVVTISDETILKDEVTSDYYLDFDGEDKVLLVVRGAGALSYLPNSTDETFVITAFTSQQITATGLNTGTTMNLVASSAADLAANAEARRVAILERNKALFMEQIKTDLSNGVIRTASGEFLAHYAIDRETTESVKVSLIEDGVLTHTTYPLTITADDEKAILDLGELDLNGNGLSKIYYAFANGKMTLDNSALTVDDNQDARAYFVSGLQTHVVSATNNKGAAPTQIWNELGWNSYVSDLELSDRDTRPFVFCPGSGQAPEGPMWYTFYYTNWSLGEEVDRIYFSKGAPDYPFGAYYDHGAVLEREMPTLFEFLFNEEGHYMVDDSYDGKHRIYLLEVNGENWLRFDR